MSGGGNPFYPSIDALPPTLPIFPLPGVLLLPRGRLPLNIFEPRYLAMTRDALGGDRLIGMIQPQDAEADLAVRPRGAQLPVYTVGCAGRITQFSESGDGRFLITLTGIARFRIANELPLMPGLYRKVTADWRPFAADLEEPASGAFDRSSLLAAMRGYFDHRGLGVNWEAVEKAGDETLVSALAMVCPFEPSEKQALLECADLAARARLLLQLVEMDRLAQVTPPTARPQ